MSTSNCFFGITFLGYLLASVLHLANLTAPKTDWTRTTRWATLFSWSVHTVGLILRGLAYHRAPFSDPFESASFLAWTIVLIFLILEKAFRASALGAVALPVAFFTLFIATFLPSRERITLPVSSVLAIKVHIALSLLGYGSLTLAFCVAILYLLQERRLKQKHLLPFWHRYLPLEYADLLANRLVALGFALLTMGLVTGVYFARQGWERAWYLDAKFLSTTFTWLIYAFYLYARDIAGWRGRKTMFLLVAGFAAVLLGYLGINFLGLSQHRF